MSICGVHSTLFDFQFPFKFQDITNSGLMIIKDKFQFPTQLNAKCNSEKGIGLEFY